MGSPEPPLSWMGRLRLFEGEEFVARFRPHPFAYGRRYLGSLLWTLAGAVGAVVTALVGGDHPTSWGLVTLAGLGLLAALVFGRFTKQRSGFPWLAASTSLALVVLDVFDLLPWPLERWTLPLLLGAAFTFLRLVGWEAERLNRLHFLTTDRLVIRGGVGSRRERTVAVKRIQEVRSEHGFLGQALDYGNLILVLGRQVRGKEAQVFEEREELRGIGRLGEIKHHVEQLAEETRMPPKDRRRRMDERRVKESMRVLARWMRREARRHP